MSGLAPGVRVEVRTGFDRRWAKGFEVASVNDDDRYVLRRVSDGSVLPAEFSPDDIRSERRQGMWWAS